MANEVQWTRQQQANALSVIPMVEAVVSSNDPERNVAAAQREVVKLVPGGQDADDAAFASVAPDIITGLVNLAGMLADWHARDTGISVDQVLRNAEEAVRTVKLID